MVNYKLKLKPSPFSVHSLSSTLTFLFNDRRTQAFIPWVFPVFILNIWQFLSTFGLILIRVLSAPLAVVIAAIRLARTGELFVNIGVIARRAIPGFVISGSIGFLLGLLNGISPISEKLFDTSIQMLGTVPSLALLPLVILWFEIEDEARLFLVSLGVMFPIYLNTFYGIRNVDPGLIEMGRVYGFNT